VAGSWVRGVGLFAVFAVVLLDVMGRFAGEWHAYFVVYLSSLTVVFNGDRHDGHSHGVRAAECALTTPHAVSSSTARFEVVARVPSSGVSWRRVFGLWRSFPAGNMRARIVVNGLTVCALDLIGGHVQPRGHGPARFHTVGRQHTSAVCRTDGASRSGDSGEPFRETLDVCMEDARHVRFRGVVQGRQPVGVFVMRSLVKHEFDVRATLKAGVAEGDAFVVHFSFGATRTSTSGRGVFVRE